MRFWMPFRSYKTFNRTVRHSSLNVLRHQSHIEALEDRRLLASLTWGNRGNDGFEFFEENPEFELEDAEVAREVVDAAIETWNRTVTGYNGQELNVDLEIFVDPDDGGTYAEASGSSDENGVPLSGEVRIANSTATSVQWFFDETPFEHSEYQGNRVNVFARQPQSDSPGADKADLYSVMMHEIGHIMGISSGAKLLYDEDVANVTMIATGLANDASDETADDLFWVFQGDTTNALMTNFNLSGVTNQAGHTARPRPGNAPVNEGATTVYGSVDLMNGTTSFDLSAIPRTLFSKKLAMMLDDMGYDVVMPERFGTMHTILDA